MNLRFCTLTGADNTTLLYQMKQLSELYPFVEWGLLYSPKLAGISKRFPEKRIITHFLDRFDIENVALHFCGAAVQQCISQHPDIMDLVERIGNCNGRIQLNFNHKRTPINIDKLQQTLSMFPTIEFVTQYNINNVGVAYELSEFTNHSVLFDESGGSGSDCIIKDPLSDINCGYAGGFGPLNITQKLMEMQQTLPVNYTTWIDMEGNIRSNDYFDLEKCGQVLQSVNDIIKPHLIQQCVVFLRDYINE